MSSTALKWVALVTMLIDHIGVFIPGVPVELRWIGRIAAPLFLFCFAYSLEYTKDRTMLLARIYLFGMLMGIVNFLVNLLYHDTYTLMSNNFFSTLFLIGMCVVTVDMYRYDKASGKRVFVIFGIVEVISIILCTMAGSIQPDMHLEFLIQAFAPNFLFTEGGFLIVVCGLLMYRFRHERKYLSGAFALLCVVYAVTVMLQSGVRSAFFTDYQWMMILAVPFMLVYNEKKGNAPNKYLFYVFYPLHIWILFALGNTI